MKKMAKKVIAATLVTSAIVPVMAVSANTTTEISFVLVEQGGQTYQISIDAYEKAVARDTFNFEIKNIVIDGKIYSITDYEKAVARNGQDAALTALKESGTPVTVTVSEGAFNPTTGVITPGTPQAGELKVESVSAIDETGVEVTFPALTAKVTDATVEVKNSKDEVVAVLAQDLSEGATSAYFDFEKNVAAADLTGLWTVDGKEYSFDVLDAVDSIVENTTNPVKLALALEAAGIKGANEDLVLAYGSAIDAADADKEITTLAEIQAIVDQINADVAAVVTIVETIEAGSPVKIYNILNSNLKRVNSDLVDDYLDATIELKDKTTEFVEDLEAASDVTNVTVEALQSAIDRVNLEAVYGLYTTAASTMTKEDIAKVKTAATTYTDGSDVYAYLADSIKELELVRAVLDADKATTIKKAITSLVAFDSEIAIKYKDAEDFDVVKADLTDATITINADVTTVLFKDVAILDGNVFSSDVAVKTYASVLKATAATPGNMNSTKDVRDAVVSVNNDRATDLYTAIEEAATQADLLTALKASGLKQYAEANKEVYFPTAGANKFDGITTTATVMQAQLDTLNIKAATDATTAKDVLAALNVFGIDNIVTANGEAYKGITATAGATNAATVTAVKDAVAAINKVVTVNKQVDAINAAKTVSEVNAALAILADLDEVADYLGVRSIDSEFVAAYVLEKLPATPGYTSLANVATEVTAAKSAYTTALGGVNALELTSEPADIQAALVAILDENYDALTNNQKATKAEEFHGKLEFKEDGTIKTPFVSLKAIKDLLNK